MKKIILLLFLFISCYLIFILTEDSSLSVVAIGDEIADNRYIKENSKVGEYNNNFIQKDYRIIDLINIIKYNEELEKENKRISIHRLLKNADILILSIGMNDIYYKLNENTKDVYSYINTMINNMEILLSEIDKYNYQKVYVLGYYNITNKNNDIFTYINYKLKKITEQKHYRYIELNDILKNNPNLYQKNKHFALNNDGYKEINKIIVENLKKY